MRDFRSGRGGFLNFVKLSTIELQPSRLLRINTSCKDRDLSGRASQRSDRASSLSVYGVQVEQRGFAFHPHPSPSRTIHRYQSGYGYISSVRRRPLHEQLAVLNPVRPDKSLHCWKSRQTPVEGRVPYPREFACDGASINRRWPFHAC